jgi:hypothetical protein
MLYLVPHLQDHCAEILSEGSKTIIEAQKVGFETRGILTEDQKGPDL